MDADAYPQELLADEEPKYLRRQKPLEIKRRKFGRKAWKTYLRVTFGVGIGIAGACAAYAGGHFLLASRQMALVHPEQVELSGNHYVTQGNVLAIFRADQGRSVLRIPLSERRQQIRAIPWVSEAIVRRALPNKIEVEITERTPIAFLRQGSDLALVDIHGVILERPLKANFHFPVVTGIREDMTSEERERRMQLFAGFSQQAELTRAGAMEQVSEVDLSDASDLRASISGLNGNDVLRSDSLNQLSDHAGHGSVAPTDSPVLVHFGDNDFETKYRTLLDGIAQWRSKTGRVESVDLRFNGEAIVNPDSPVIAQPAPRPLAAARPASKPAPVVARKPAKPIQAAQKNSKKAKKKPHNGN
ncbi:MAG: FtsQ-type POTRA domain-containing protein [Candidatus Acidiferrales bacterium]